MIHLKQNPIGIDDAIQGLQKYLYDNLKYDLKAYGRAYKTERNNKTIPEVYIEGSCEYKEVLINDCENGSFFFIENSETQINNHLFTTNVDLIFSINLSRVEPLIKHRADEEVKMNIYDILSNKIYRTDIIITKGIEALNGFDTKLIDMQPNMFIKYSFDLTYNKKC